MKFQYVDGCCGSGKTTALVAHLNTASGKTVVASKTIALSQQTASGLTPSVSRRIINHQTVSDVRKAMEEALVDPSVSVLFVTHQAVIRNHKLLGAGMAHLVIDEVPEVESSFDRNLSYTYHKEFRRYFEADECQGYDGVTLKLIEAHRDEALVKARNSLADDHVNVTVDMWRKVVNPNWALVMSNAQWLTDSHRLPPVSHGMNTHAAECAVVCLFSLNDYGFHANYLSKRHGIEADDLHASRAGEAAYQLIMRTNLRDPNGYQDVIAWVPDRRTAAFVQSLLPGSKIEYVDLGIEGLRLSKSADKRPTLNPAQRNKAYMDRQRALRTRFAEVVSLHGAVSAEYGDKPVQFTLEESVVAGRDQVLDMQMASWDELRGFLLDDCYPRHIKDKESNFLICGSLLNKDATPDSYKGKANVVYSTILQIDFDDSDLDPTLASKVLSNIKHLIYNSYNTMKNGKPRYRCIIPLKQAIESALYELIWEAVTQRFVDLGFNVGKRIVGDLDSGVDCGKDHAASFMYLPSQAKVRGASFWHECWDAPVFDCSEWLERLLPEEAEFVSVAQLERIEADRRAQLVLAGSGLKLDQLRQQSSKAAKAQSLERFQQKFAEVGPGEMHGAILSLMHTLVNGGHMGWEVEQIMLGALAGRAGGQDHTADVKRNCRAIDAGKFKRP